MRPSNTASGPHAGERVLTAGKPLGQSPVVVIMIHGRGAGPQNILDLAPALAHPDVTYLAPAAANNTWYPYSFMSEIDRNEPYLSSALSVLTSLVSQVEAAGIRRDHIVMLGFSQGACLATEFAIRNASRFGGFVAFSGGAIGPPGTKWGTGEEFRVRSAECGPFDGTPIFFGCSNVDPHIPEPRVIESAQLCERMGAKVTTRIYPGMGHLVNDDEITWASALLSAAMNAP
ncbi:MAG TPA: dienelactone hydrolase family protein [Vicinamibacterales bacterium]|nr:dienelactone hydrolase family protein [Vicinamibacterales bacterium]